MIESDFQVQLVKGLSSMPESKFRKYPDLAKGIRKPYDIYGCCKGRHIVIEAKFTKVDSGAWWSSTTIVASVKMVERHQEDSLVEEKKAGALCYIAVGYYSTNGKCRKAWLIPIEVWMQFHRDDKITQAAMDVLVDKGTAMELKEVGGGWKLKEGEEFK